MTDQVADDLVATVDAAWNDLRRLDESATSHRPAADRWKIKEVIGHLVDSAANNHQRFVRAQFVAELTFPKYEQNEWVRCQHYNDVEWIDLLNFWRWYNHHLGHVIRQIDPAKLDTRCTIGPYEPVTLAFLIEDYVVHLKHHLAKIAERVATSD